MSDCCCPEASNDGVPSGGGGGGDSPEMELDFTTTDAVPVATGLVSLPANGAHALVVDFSVQTVNETAGAEGQGMGSWFLPMGTALRNAVDGSVLISGPRVGLVAPTVLWPIGIGGGGIMLGYGAGPVFGAPLAGAVLAIVANVLTLTATGIAATTLRWHMRARVWAFDGAVRLI